MAEVKWIRINTDMFDNAKIKYLRTLPEGNNIILIWVMLLAKAGKCNSNGYIFLTENIPYTPEILAAEFDFEISTIHLALGALSKLNMILQSEETLFITGWEEHQNVEGLEKIREQTRRRVAKCREKQKFLPSNATCNVTVTESNATDKEREEEREREEDKNNIKKEKKKTEFDVIIQNYTDNEEFQRVIYEFVKMRKAIKAPMTSNALKLMLKKLDKLETDVYLKVDILEQSIMNSWKGIFPLKKEDAGYKKSNGYYSQLSAMDNLKELYKEAELKDEQEGNNTANSPFGF